MSYLEDFNADQIALVSVDIRTPILANSRYQLSDIAEGLCYLHSRGIIHGDLKGVYDSNPCLITLLMLYSPIFS